MTAEELHTILMKTKTTSTMSARGTPIKTEMTLDRARFLVELMKWYWDLAQPKGLISKSDYEFIYDIWNNGLSFYDDGIQERLNNIRTIYVNSIKNGDYKT